MLSNRISTPCWKSTLTVNYRVTPDGIVVPGHPPISRAFLKRVKASAQVVIEAAPDYTLFDAVQLAAECVPPVTNKQNRVIGFSVRYLVAAGYLPIIPYGDTSGNLHLYAKVPGEPPLRDTAPPTTTESLPG